MQRARQSCGFVPMVLEAHSGGRGKAARQTLNAIAKSTSAPSRGSADLASLRIAQRLSTTLHRENARAILRRPHQPDQADVVDELVFEEFTENPTGT